MEQSQLYYLAGIIDGEGYLGILKLRSSASKKWDYYYSSAVKVAQVNEKLCPMLKDQFGGYLTKRIHAQINHNLSYMWEIKNDRQVGNFLNIIQDKLIVKSAQAEVLKRFIEFRNSIRHRMFRGYTQQDFETFESLYREIRNLNYRGIRPAETK